jgi:hypothetical protein
VADDFGIAPLQITTLTLCDFAQVRENLLFVSSGGISRVVSSNFPANLRLQLAMIIHVPAFEIGNSHKVRARLTYPETAEPVANIDVGVQINEAKGVYPGEGLNLPRVFDLSAIAFPRSGQVDIRVSVDDQPAGDLSFWLLAQKRAAAKDRPPAQD